MDLKAEDLVPRLVSEYGYDEEQANQLAEDLAACQPEIQEAFLFWWNEGKFSPLEVEGYTVQSLIEQHSLRPVGAFLALDWLATEPAEARAMLARGYDRVGGAQA